MKYLVVINADSMQVYQDLEILSNRPSKTELGSIENKLFGVIETPNSADLDGGQNLLKLRLQKLK